MPIVTIYYYGSISRMQFDDIENIMLKGNIHIKSIINHHLPVHSVRETKINNINEYLEMLYEKFNSDNNPLCTVENQKFIKSIGTHTSMSVGDIVKITDESKCNNLSNNLCGNLCNNVCSKYYIVKPTGFVEMS